MTALNANMAAAISGARVPPPDEYAQKLIATLSPMRTGGRIWCGGLFILVLLGAVAYITPLMHGLSVTAMNDYFSWGMYIINFVFFIGISMAGTLISAMLRLTGAGWRH